MFYKKVDLRNKEAMVGFLSNHFRYYTMNSWNRLHSYANNMKIYNVIPSEFRSTVYEMFETEGFYHGINSMIKDWEIDHNYNFSCGFNGRSSGYLVLYNSERVDSGYKSYCVACGQLNYKTIKETGNNRCGKCGELTRKDFDKIHYKINIKSVGVDSDVDWKECSMDFLRDRVKLIQSFDKLCDDIVAHVINMTKEKEVIDDVQIIHKPIKVLRDKDEKQKKKQKN